MSAPRHTWLSARRRAGRGLVLVELLLFLLVLLLAGMLAWMGLNRVRQHQRLAKFGAELQGFATHLEQSRTERGRWPATLPAGGHPAPGPAFGGEYGWVPPAAGRPGMITLTAFAPGFPLELSRADLVEVDRRIDDGDLATGRFRTGFNGWPVYLVMERR